MNRVHQPKTDNPIGIIGATRTEIGSFRKKLELMEKERAGNARFYRGRYSAREVVLTKCGIGYAQALSACTHLIGRFAPSAICSFGLAGSVERSLSIGEIVLATHLLWMKDMGTFEVEKSYTMDKDLIDIISNILNKYSLSFKKGKLLTVPHFIFRRTDRDRIRRELEVDAVEMEGAAIAGAARRHSIPVMALRVISDDLFSREIDFGVLMRPSGRTSLRGLVRFGRAHGRDFREVFRFGKQARELGKNLCEIQTRIVGEIPLPGDQAHGERGHDG
jgi:adenosylhomocysteine nucleosidase